ncbi:hypothetical protein [Orientia tsutsugamushi]|nr:hypothetical protein [Orientia tsutsugamushi]
MNAKKYKKDKNKEVILKNKKNDYDVYSKDFLVNRRLLAMENRKNNV